MKEKFIIFFDFVIYWTMILFPFAMAIAPAPANVFMGWLFLSYTMKKILKKERIFLERVPIIVPFLALFIASAISIINTIDYSSSVRGLFKLVQYFFIFVILSEEVKDKRHLIKIIAAMVCGITLASVDGIWQIVTGSDFIRGNAPIFNLGLTRATAAFPNANVLGVYLSAIIPLLSAIVLYYLKGKNKFLSIVLLGVCLIGLALTFSRPALLGVYIVILASAFIRKRKILVAILLLIIILVPILAPKDIKDWAKEEKYNPVVLLCNRDRISIYFNSLNMIKSHPIIGVGVSTFSNNYPFYKIPEVEKRWGGTGEHMYAHNNFLQMTGEIGLLGLLMFLWLLFTLFKSWHRTNKVLEDDFLKIVSLGICMCLVSFLINGLTETSLYYSRVSMIFWYLVGLSLSLRSLNYRKKTLT